MLVEIIRDCIIDGKEYKKGQKVEVKIFYPSCMKKINEVKEDKGIKQEKKKNKKK